MLKGLQANLERFIQGFQDRLETQAAFRTTWSLIGVLVATVLICGISGLVLTNIGAIGLGGAGNQAFSQNSGSGANSSSTYPIPAYTASTGDGSTPPAVFVATSSATPPTTTPVPTELSGTPSPTPTITPIPGGGGTTVAVQATQVPRPWTLSQTPSLTNFRTFPAQPNSTLNLDKLDFSGGTGACTLTVTGGYIGTVNLGSDGTNQADSISFTFPSCVQSFLQGTKQPIAVLAYYDGYGGNGYFTGSATYSLSSH